jgi:hypothetical protein
MKRSIIANPGLWNVQGCAGEGLERWEYKALVSAGLQTKLPSDAAPAFINVAEYL